MMISVRDIDLFPRNTKAIWGSACLTQFCAGDFAVSSAPQTKGQCNLWARFPLAREIDLRHKRAPSQGLRASGCWSRPARVRSAHLVFRRTKEVAFVAQSGESAGEIRRSPVQIRSGAQRG